MGELNIISETNYANLEFLGTGTIEITKPASDYIETVSINHGYSDALFMEAYMQVEGSDRYLPMTWLEIEQSGANAGKTVYELFSGVTGEIVFAQISASSLAGGYDTEINAVMTYFLFRERGGSTI